MSLSTRDVSISLLLGASFGALTLILAIIIGNTLVASRGVAGSIQDVENHHLSGYTKALWIHEQYQDFVLDLENAVVTGERSLLDTYPRRAAAIDEALRAQIPVGDSEHRTLVRKLRQQFREYQEKVTTLVALMLDSDETQSSYEEISRLSETVGRLRESFEPNLARLVDIRREEVSQALRATGAAVRGLAIRGVCLGVVSLGVSFVTFLQIRRRIVLPVQELSVHARRLASGDLESNLPAANDTRDEIGRLWSDFVSMTEGLRSTTVSRNYVQGIIRSMAEALVVLDDDMRVRTHNPAAADLLGYEESQLQGASFDAVFPEARDVLPDLTADKGAPEIAIRTTWLHRSGESIPVSMSVKTLDGVDSRSVVVAKDIREDLQAEEERLALGRQLEQASKLEAVGQLAAGIAHEINTPMQFIGDNTRYVRDGLRGLKRMLEVQAKLVDVNRAHGTNGDILEVIDRTREETDCTYLLDESGVALEQSLEGVDRVTQIVRAMKEFAHPDSDTKTPEDINHAIQTSVTVSRNEWKYVADVDLDLDESLPPVPCLVGPFNQVIVNMIVNAAHAIEEHRAGATGGKGVIKIRTCRSGPWAEITVADDGAGIREEHLNRVFEPFFTTKQVGKGTGQGLSIAHSVVTKQHGGTISVESKVGVGTTFTMRLPLVEAARETDAPGPVAVP